MRWCYTGFVILAVLVLTPDIVVTQGSGTIAGTVVGSCATEGIDVKVVKIGDDLTAGARTDAEGRFQVNSLPVGVYSVFPDLDAFRESRRVEVELREGENKPVDFEVGIYLSGSVSCDGTPYEGYIVEVGLSRNGGTATGQCRRTAKTDEQGVFEIAGLAAGNYNVSVRRGVREFGEMQPVELGRAEWHSHDMVWCPSRSASDFGYSRWKSGGTTWAR